MINVTACVPCFEQAEFLPDALSSLSEQTVRPFEVIVVDDGSSPEQAATIDDVCRSFPRLNVRLMQITNRGLPNARNAALMVARGDGFLPLDADDWLDARYIELTAPLLLEADVVLTGLQEHGVREGVYMPGFDRPFDRVGLDEMRTMNRFFYCSMFRTTTLREVGGYNGRMIHGYEDWDLWIDLMSRGYRFTEVREVLFHYRTRDGSMLAETEAHYRQWNYDEMTRHHKVPCGR